ncbi:caspase family protein [Thalassovita taeanensis]|uniref:Caspase domain-containing protein n=1 Tax=Thalassovita taeanensis TaxID=657014 RepID=A0A1H9AGN7_9RHOB|nr:caspase family protein [Thalassovita taeanensis]SEP75952.1 Caspase domain-containing protein [Thalassovita taeanensis]
MRFFPSCAWATALALLAAVPAVARENYALLIGASTYPALDQRFWLKGPANDIDLVQTYLTSNPALPFAPDHITILADGIPGQTAPTLSAIRDGFAALAATVQPGDFVYLHFSGHGSQSPAIDPDAELDGLDELFLPVDIGPWDDSVGTVQNALVDDEIGQLIDSLRDKGADVWVVFDSCHSGTATRAAPTGDDEVRLRQLAPEALGVPADRLAEAESHARALPDPRAQAPAPVETTADVGKGRLVAFFAAQTNETTPEKNMPKGKQGRRLQGVFTYTLFETLAERPGVTYRQLGQEVLRKYSTRNLARSTPMFEGDLDVPVFGAGGSAGRVLQWSATPDKDGLSLRAGRLHGLSEGSALLLLASPADADDAALARYRVTTLSAFAATATNTADGPAPEIPRGAVLRLAGESVDLSLTIALPPVGSAPADHLTAAQRIMQADALIGPRIQFVPAGAEADLRLAVFPDSPRPDALWVLPASGQIDDSELARTPSVSTADKTAAELAEVMADTLTRMSKALNLLKVGAAASGGQLRLEAGLVTARFDPDREEVIETTRNPVDTANVPRMIPNDVIGLRLKNPNDIAVDFNVLYVGADYAITFMGNGRMQPGGTLNEDYVLVTDDSFGRDRLLVIVTPAAAQTVIEDLSFLEQSAVDRTRSTAAGRVGLAGLLDEAGFGQTTRAAISLSSRRKKAAPAPVFLQFEIDTVPGTGG